MRDRSGTGADPGGVARVQALIDKQRQRRQSNRVLHGHPSPLFWLERDVPVSTIMAEREAANTAIPKRVNLYVATPYCLPTTPDRCGFCLFPSEIYRGKYQLDEYLRDLDREGGMYREFFAGNRLATVYFGGGTSNLYHASQYRRLLDIVRGVFPDFGPDVEATLEGIPQLFTAEKLTAMKAAGVTRISIGVQQLDDELIAMSGRKQKADHVFRTLEWCAGLGLPASVDLIFGWPRQTLDHMLHDLEAMVRAGVPHLTHYELNVAGRTDFARNRREELPSLEQTLEMYRVSAQFLEAHGYRQVTPYDWEKVDTPLAGTYQYEDIMRTPFRAEADDRLIGFDVWGWGFAGISFLFGTPDTPGWAFMNTVHVDDYSKALDAGRFPVERGFHYTERDLRIHVLFQALQGMSVDLVAYHKVFGVDVVAEHAAIWQALVERGWVELTDTRARLVGDGGFYTPLIQSLFAHERTEEMRKANR